MAITHYDPNEAPDPEQWLKLEEFERIALARDYHEHEGTELPNVKVHAMMHVVIETQVAHGDEWPVRRKLGQLQAQGLDRHEAIHAIASVLVRHIHKVMKAPTGKSDPNEASFREVQRLTAKSWRRSG